MTQAELNARALCAWREWSDAVIPAPLLKELEASAGECGLNLPHFIAEVLQSYAALERLPNRITRWRSPAGYS
jgi:hypothetical protein